MLVKKIPLQIHSHKGDQFVPPQNLLNGSSSQGYYSVCDTIKDDWIIFSSKESMSYIPTRLKLEVSPFSKECPKDFNIYIGDGDKDEWIKCNDETLCGKQEQYEEFVLFDIVRIYDEYDNRWIYKDKMFALTHGFIRSCSNAIPDDIISICMAYTDGDNHKIEAIVKNLAEGTCRTTAVG